MRRRHWMGGLLRRALVASLLSCIRSQLTIAAAILARCSDCTRKQNIFLTLESVPTGPAIRCARGGGVPTFVFAPRVSTSSRWKLQEQRAFKGSHGTHTQGVSANICTASSSSTGSARSAASFHSAVARRRPALQGPADAGAQPLLRRQKGKLKKGPRHSIVAHLSRGRPSSKTTRR